MATAVGAGVTRLRRPRASVTADVSCSLLELDFSGIEAVLTGYFMWRHLGDAVGAKHYIRQCQLGMHAIVTALKVQQPINLARPDADVIVDIARVKKEFATEYDIIKRVVHGTNYGLTPFGCVEMFPEYFRSITEAEEAQRFLFQAAPTLPAWQTAVRRRARDVGYLGGTTLAPAPPSCWDHPFGYKHWFWDVLTYKPCDEFTAAKWRQDPRRRDRIVVLHGRPFKIEFGSDSKRTCAYYPQSGGSGVLKRAESRLFHPESPDYIGDAYFGRTPLLHPIHDSLFLHVPNRILDRVAAICARVMQDPIPQLPIPPEWQMGDYLRIGVEAKVGRSWDKDAMHKWPVPGIVYSAGAAPAAHVADDPVIAREPEEQEAWEELGRTVA